MWPYLDFDLLRWVTLVQFTVRSFRQMVLTWTQHGGAWPRDEPKTWTNQFQSLFLFPVISNHNTLNARGYNLLTASHDRSVKIWDSTTLDSHQCATDGSCGFATFHGAMGRGNLCNTSWAAGLRIWHVWNPDEMTIACHLNVPMTIAGRCWHRHQVVEASGLEAVRRLWQSEELSRVVVKGNDAMMVVLCWSPTSIGFLRIAGYITGISGYMSYSHMSLWPHMTSSVGWGRPLWWKSAIAWGGPSDLSQFRSTF